MVSSDDVGQDSTIWTVRGFPFIQPSSWPHNLPLAVPILALGPITCRVLQGTVYSVQAPIRLQSRCRQQATWAFSQATRGYHSRTSQVL